MGERMTLFTREPEGESAAEELVKSFICAEVNIKATPMLSHPIKRPVNVILLISVLTCCGTECYNTYKHTHTHSHAHR